MKNSLSVRLAVTLCRCVLGALGIIFFVASAFSSGILDLSGFGDLIASSLSALLAAALFADLRTRPQILLFSLICVVGLASILLRAYAYFAQGMAPSSKIVWVVELLFLLFFSLVFIGRMRNVLFR